MASLTRVIGRPQVGFWLIRLGKQTPWTPACIMRLQTHYEPGEPENKMERSSFLAAFVNGEPVDIEAVWHRRGLPITEAEYRYKVALTDWAIQSAPNDPIANPAEKVSWMHSRPVF